MRLRRDLITGSADAVDTALFNYTYEGIIDEDGVLRVADIRKAQRRRQGRRAYSIGEVDGSEETPAFMPFAYGNLGRRLHRAGRETNDWRSSA